MNITDQKLLFRSGVRDAEDIGHLRAHACPGSVFLDVGANIGYYSMSAAQMGYERLVSVEPNPVLIERLTFNTQANNLEKRLTVVPVAVSDQRGEMFLDAPGDMGSGRVKAEASGGHAIRVPVEPLADILNRLGVARVTAFKIDVEGHEDRALLPYLRGLADEDLPKLGIIEYVHGSEWKEDLISYLLTRDYSVVLKNRSNIILRRG